MKKCKKIVVTGGPGSGKTSLIQALENRGFPVFHEISRQLIAEAQQAGTQNYFKEAPIPFSQKLLDARIQQFHQANAALDPFVFLDRGLPDVIAYFDSIEQDSPFSINLKQEYRYDQVFFLPPWEAIYQQDSQRMETFVEAQEIGRILLSHYTKLNYAPVKIPPGTLSERCDFLLTQIGYG